MRAKKSPLRDEPQRGFEITGFLPLRSSPRVGYNPRLCSEASPPTPVIDALTREENTAADLPSHVVPGGEEVGIDHVDFFP